jgi:hypothetical protein
MYVDYEPDHHIVEQGKGRTTTRVLKDTEYLRLQRKKKRLS